MIKKTCKSISNIAIIGSLKFKDKDFVFFPFILIKYVREYFKYFFFKFLNKERYNKARWQISILNEWRWHKIEGHRMLCFSLFRGLEKIGIPYTYNKITNQTDYVVLLWADTNDLLKLEKIKSKYQIKKVVTSPIASARDYIRKSRIVDFLACASDTITKSTKNKVDSEYKNKVVTWACGVKIPSEKPCKINKMSILYFCKYKPVNDDLICYLNSKGYSVSTFIYGKYKFGQWDEALEKADLAIFDQDICETQGVAFAEAWAQDVPTLIKYNENTEGGVTAPYLTDKTGIYYHTYQELKAILELYEKDRSMFLKKFSPYEWCRENMSDEISVQRLMNILTMEDKRQ